MTLLEQVGFFTGLGVVIVFLAALVLGRFTVVAVSDTAHKSAAAQADGTAPATRSRARITPVKVFGGRPRDADKAETEPAEAEPAQTR